MRRVKGTTLTVEQYREMASEAEWERAVIDLAGHLGWECHHVYDSRRFWPGFPDWMMLRAANAEREGRIIFVELKRETGVQTPAQERWQGKILYAGGEAYCWRPSDYETVQAVLR